MRLEDRLIGEIPCTIVLTCNMCSFVFLLQDLPQHVLVLSATALYCIDDSGTDHGWHVVEMKTT